jgi:hypothetical protein
VGAEKAVIDAPFKGVNAGLNGLENACGTI